MRQLLIVFLGAQRVGKTSIIKQFLYGSFQEVTESTLGNCYNETVCLPNEKLENVEHSILCRWGGELNHNNSWKTLGHKLQMTTKQVRTFESSESAGVGILYHLMDKNKDVTIEELMSLLQEDQVLSATLKLIMSVLGERDEDNINSSQSNHTEHENTDENETRTRQPLNESTDFTGSRKSESNFVPPQAMDEETAGALDGDNNNSSQSNHTEHDNAGKNETRTRQPLNVSTDFTGSRKSDSNSVPPKSTCEETTGALDVDNINSSNSNKAEHESAEEDETRTRQPSNVTNFTGLKKSYSNSVPPKPTSEETTVIKRSRSKHEDGKNAGDNETVTSCYGITDSMSTSNGSTCDDVTSVKQIVAFPIQVSDHSSGKTPEMETRALQQDVLNLEDMQNYRDIQDSLPEQDVNVAQNDAQMCSSFLNRFQYSVEESSENLVNNVSSPNNINNIT